MGLEQTHVRSPLAKTINALPNWRWIPSRNAVRFDPSSLQAGFIPAVTPGTPDGYAHKWGGQGIIYFETKAVEISQPTSLDMHVWDRQRNWWEKNCRDLGDVPYWIVAGWYSYAVERTSDMEWPSWRWFAVTPQMWLSVQGRLPDGQVSLPLNPLTARKSHLDRELTAEGEWAEYALYYKSGMLVIPEVHPLHQQLGAT
jgi:hypothetical protein